MFTFNKPAIRLLITLLEDPLRRNSAAETISRAALARNHYLKRASFLVAEAVRFPYRCGKVWQVLQDVNGDDAIEVVRRETEFFLTVSDNGLYLRESPLDLGRHVSA